MKALAKKIIGPRNITLFKLHLSYALWKMKGKLVPAHGLYKWSILRKTAARNGIDTLIETGTAGGGTMLKLEKHFKKLYTIELDPLLYEQGKTLIDGRKRQISSIECLKGDSGVVIKEILANLREPALFWLDAHYSGQGTARGALDTPIVQELQSIFSHGVKGHAIVIDDMREFNGSNDYPKLSELEKIIAEKAPQYRASRDNDLLIIEPVTATEVRP